MIRAAIAGLGRWGRNHVNAVQGASGRLRFVRGVVRHPAAARDFAAGHGIELTDDYAAVLADPRVDAVVLATPNSLHAEQIVAAARAGKPVFCEKPLALTRADAERAARACAEAGVVLAVGQDKRFWPSMRELRRVVESGELGRVLHAEGHFSNENARSLHRGWRESPDEAPGASLTGTGIHVLDAFVSLMGPVRRVEAQLLAYRAPPEPIDTLSVLMEFAGGASGVLCGVRATPLFWRVHIFGIEGSVESVSDTELVLRKSGVRPQRLVFEPENALRYELEAFADAVEGRAPYPIPVPQMLDTIGALEAIVESMHARAPVALDAR